VYMNKNYRDEKQKIEAMKLSPEEKYKRMDALERKRHIAGKMAKEQTDKMASDTPDVMPDMYNKALRYFLDGKFDKALATLDDEAIEECVKEHKQGLRGCSVSYLLKAHFKLSELDFEEAETYYVKALKAHPGNLDVIHEYGGFLYDQNKFTEALIVYQGGLKPGMALGDKAGLLNGMGNQNYKLNNFKAALENYSEALSLYRDLSKSNPAAYKSDVAMSLNNLGLLYKATNRLSDALAAYSEALSIKEDLAKLNPERFDLGLCRTLLALGLYYLNPKMENYGLESIAKARAHLERARTIAQKYPQVPLAKNIIRATTELLDQAKATLKKK
ncbi:MAG: tetratricopeptide repeat protein, partial [bacterium]|nr:tetratricopeptide repeat protein [bacterium]